MSVRVTRRSMNKMQNDSASTSTSTSSEERMEVEDSLMEECPLFVQQYSIVKGILEKLPIKDLLVASRVCQHWREVGRVVRKQRRNRPTSYLWHPYGDHTAEVFEYYNAVEVSVVVQRFMSTVTTLGFPSVQELTEERNWSPLFPQMRKALMKDFCSQYYEPQLMVLVATAGVDEYMPSDEDNITKLKIILSDIPRAIPCLVAISYGIVGSLRGEEKSLEMESSEFPIIAGLNIPKVQGMTVRMFTCTKETNAKYKGKGMVDSETCKQILNIQPEDNVKAIVLFHTDIRKAGALKEAIFQYIKDNPHVALGGGSHYRNLASVCQGDFVPIGAGLVICGDENVNAASVGFFDSKISTRNEEKLIAMKRAEFSDGDSFAFMFACNGRGANMHGRTHVESTVFRKHFPKTHLIGTFTGGEYCHEVIPGGGCPPPPTKATNLEFAYTSVFVFISYRNPKNQTHS